MPPWLAIVGGLWAFAMLATFIVAIRLSYRIEGRSPDLKNMSGYPRNAMMFHTITNRRVSRDPQTQALRRRMNLLLLLVLVGFASFGLWIRYASASAS